VPFCQMAAPIAAFTGDPGPEAETGGTRRRPVRRGGQGRSASGGWQPGGYFVLAMQSRAQPGGGK